MPTLNIGGESFECAEKLSDWRMMKLAKAVQAKNALTRYSGMHDFVMAVLLPDKRDEFEAFMDDFAPDEQDLDDAIGALIKAYSDRPSERPSTSPPGPPTTGGSSRVVSLTPDSARAAPESPKAGHSRAS
jgi:hypothetical protein